MSQRASGHQHNAMRYAVPHRMHSDKQPAPLTIPKHAAPLQVTRHPSINQPTSTDPGSELRTAYKLLDHHFSSELNHTKSCVLHRSCRAQPDCHLPPRSVTWAPPAGKPLQRHAATSTRHIARCTLDPQPHQIRQPGSKGRLRKHEPGPRGQLHTRLASRHRPPRTGSGAPLLPQHWTLRAPSPDAQAYNLRRRTPGEEARHAQRPCGRAMEHTDPCPARPGTRPELGSRARLTRSRRRGRRPPPCRAQSARPAPGAGRATQALRRPRTL